MARKHFLPKNEEDQVKFYANFAAVLGVVAPRVGVTPEEVDAIRADAEYYRYVCKAHREYAETTKALTTHKENLRDGKHLGSLPEPVTLPTPPPAVPDAPFKRLCNLVATIKRHKGYTETIGAQLRILGNEVPTLEPSVKPRLSVKFINGRPVLNWKKLGLDSVELEADRNTGTFVPVGVRVAPEYVDTTPPPSAPAVWRYRAIFRKKDETVGEWSDVASVCVLS